MTFTRWPYAHRMCEICSTSRPIVLELPITESFYVVLQTVEKAVPSIATWYLSEDVLVWHPYITSRVSKLLITLCDHELSPFKIDSKRKLQFLMMNSRSWYTYPVICHISFIHLVASLSGTEKKVRTYYIQTKFISNCYYKHSVSSRILFCNKQTNFMVSVSIHTSRNAD